MSICTKACITCISDSISKRPKSHRDESLTIYRCFWCISKILQNFDNFDIYISGLKPPGQQSKTHKRRRDPNQTVRLTCRFRFCSRLQKLMFKTFPIFKITTKFWSPGCLAFRVSFPRFRIPLERVRPYEAFGAQVA